VTLRFDPAPPAATVLLAALHRDCFPHDAWDEAAIRNLFAIPGFFARVARRGEVPIGFAFALDLGDECEALALGVVPGRRRAGAGRALLEDLCTAARDRGAAALLLEVAVNNVAARALYDAAGFVRIGCRGAYYRRQGTTVAALVLRRALAAAPST
jgi:ribosomal protein S18 acetylase RimI-like enzyme